MKLSFDWKHGIRLERHDLSKRDAWLRGEDWGEKVHAGVTVNPDTALRLSVVWRCIDLISGTLAGLPADAVRKRDLIREPVERQPRWLEVPNPETTWFEFVERTFESQLLDGNAFVYIGGRDATLFPAELWILNPTQCEIVRDGNRKMVRYGGEQMLSVYGPANPGGDVLHIKMRSGGGDRGLSPIEYAKQSIGLGLVTEKTGARFFGKGMSTSLGVELPATDGPRSKEFIDSLRAQVEEAHAGSSNSFRPLVATGGAKFFKMTITPEEAQFLQTRAFQVEDIASRIYGIPPHLVGLTEKQTSWGTGVEQQGIGLWRFTLRSHVRRFEDCMSLLLPRGQYLRLNPLALLEADAKTEADVLQTEVQNGIINRNEWRAVRDKPPIPGGERFMVPLNMQILPANGKPAPEPAPEPSPNGNGRVPAALREE